MNSATQNKTVRTRILEAAEGREMSIVNGNVHIGGKTDNVDRAGSLVALCASLGLDVITTHAGKTSKCWSVREGGEEVATIDSAVVDSSKQLVGFIRVY